MLPGLSKEEFHALVMSIGTHARARRITPIGVAQLLKKSISAPTGSKQTCAKKLGVGLTTISTFLSLEKIAPDIQHLIGWRRGEGMSIPFSVMAWISKLEHEDQRKLAAAVLELRLGWKEVVAVIQISKRSKQNIDDCIKLILKSRPDIEKQYLFMGAVSKELRLRIENMTQEERDKMLSTAMSKFIKDFDQSNCRLGAVKFSIMTYAPIENLLKQTPKSIEKFVNQALLEVPLK